MTSSRRTLVFSSPLGLNLELDYYHPPPGSALPAPFIFSVHGGGGSGGDRRDIRLWTLSLARSKGWAVISPEYRTIPESSGPAAASDVATAYHYVTSGALNKALGSQEIDGARSVVIGLAVGAWSATTVCAKSDHKPKAFISVYGVYSLSAGQWDKPAVNRIEVPGEVLEFLMPTFINMIADARAGKSPPVAGAYYNIFELTGRPLEDLFKVASANGITPAEVTAWGFDAKMTEAEKIRNLLCPWSVNEGILDGMSEGPDCTATSWKIYPRNPSGFIDENFPPTLIVHGTADYLVPFRVTEMLIEHLRVHNVRYELMKFEGLGHMLDLGWHPRTAEYAHVVSFLDSLDI